MPTGPNPPYDSLNTDGKYTWLKAPRYDGKAMEVGPLSRMLVAYVSGHERVKHWVDAALSKLGGGAAQGDHSRTSAKERDALTDSLLGQGQNQCASVEQNQQSADEDAHRAVW